MNKIKKRKLILISILTLFLPVTSNVINLSNLKTLESISYSLKSNNEFLVDAKSVGGISGNLKCKIIDDQNKYISITDAVINGVHFCADNFNFNNGIIEYLNETYKITEIQRHAFYQDHSLTGTLYIPDTIIKIGIEAFSSSSITCLNLSSANNLFEIQAFAFAGCSKITEELTIPNNVVKFGESVFLNVDWITKLVLNWSEEELSSLNFSDSYFLPKMNKKNNSLTVPNIELYKSFFKNHSMLDFLNYNFFDNSSSGTDSLTKIPSFKIGEYTWTKANNAPADVMTSIYPNEWGCSDFFSPGDKAGIYRSTYNVDVKKDFYNLSFEVPTTSVFADKIGYNKKVSYRKAVEENVVSKKLKFGFGQYGKDPFLPGTINFGKITWKGNHKIYKGSPFLRESWYRGCFDSKWSGYEKWMNESNNKVLNYDTNFSLDTVAIAADDLNNPYSFTWKSPRLLLGKNFPIDFKNQSHFCQYSLTYKMIFPVSELNLFDLIYISMSDDKNHTLSVSFDENIHFYFSLSSEVVIYNDWNATSPEPDLDENSFFNDNNNQYLKNINTYDPDIIYKDDVDYELQKNIKKKNIKMNDFYIGDDFFRKSSTNDFTQEGINIFNSVFYDHYYSTISKTLRDEYFNSNFSFSKISNCISKVKEIDDESQLQCTIKSVSFFDPYKTDNNGFFGQLADGTIIDKTSFITSFSIVKPTFKLVRNNIYKVYDEIHWKPSKFITDYTDLLRPIKITSNPKNGEIILKINNPNLSVIDYFDPEDTKPLKTYRYISRSIIAMYISGVCVGGVLFPFPIEIIKN